MQTSRPSASSASAIWAGRWRPISSRAAIRSSPMTPTRSARSRPQRTSARSPPRRSPSSAEQVDAIVTMLPTGKEVRACLLEAEGGALAANLPKGALVIDMSSADPVGTRATHADLAKRGLAFVDAPVSGGVPRATDGSLAIMIGGDAAAVAAAKPVLSKMGTRLFDVGGPGNGHAMKALNNFVAGTGFIAVAEARAGGQALRARSGRDDRRDERLDGQELQHRERREAARRFPAPVRVRLRARPAGEGRRDRGRPGEARSTWTAPSPACRPRCWARRATGWAARRTTRSPIRIGRSATKRPPAE